MCLAIPAKIIKILGQDKAVAYLGGVEREISTILLDEIAIGDYVIIHVGFALTRLNVEEAEKTLQLLTAIMETSHEIPG